MCTRGTGRSAVLGVSDRLIRYSANQLHAAL